MPDVVTIAGRNRTWQVSPTNHNRSEVAAADDVDSPSRASSHSSWTGMHDDGDESESDDEAVYAGGERVSTNSDGSTLRAGDSPALAAAPASAAWQQLMQSRLPEAAAPAWYENTRERYEALDGQPPVTPPAQGERGGQRPSVTPPRKYSDEHHETVSLKPPPVRA